MLRACVALTLALGLGCTSTVTPSDGGPGGPDATSVGVPGPDGAIGVCCRPGSPSCNCTLEGGWAPSLDECPVFGTCDVRYWGSGTDPWGCPVLIPDSLTSCLDEIDLGVVGQSAGEACTPLRGCRSATATCLHDDVLGDADVGGPDDPILGHPDGEDTVVERTRFPDGWCNTSYPGETMSTCDPANPEIVCGIVGTCAELDVGLVCLEICDPSAPGNDLCRDGYACDADHAGCLPGCQTDDECRIARQETNGVEGLQTPEDCSADPLACTPADCAGTGPADPDACSDPESNFDRLVYDTESAAVCDPESYRCTD